MRIKTSNTELLGDLIAMKNTLGEPFGFWDAIKLEVQDDDDFPARFRITSLAQSHYVSLIHTCLEAEAGVAVVCGSALINVVAVAGIDIEMTTTSDNLIVRSDGCEWTIPLMDSDRFADIERIATDVGTAKDVTVQDTTLTNALRNALQCVSEDHVRSKLRNVHVRSTGNAIEAFGTDGRILCVAKLANPDRMISPIFALNIPADAARTLIAALETHEHEYCTIIADEHRAQFISSGMTVYVHLHENEYVNTETVTGRKYKYRTDIDRIALLAALKRIKAQQNDADEYAPRVALTPTQKGLMVEVNEKYDKGIAACFRTAVTATPGDSENPTDQGETLLFDCDYLITALKDGEGDTVTLCYGCEDGSPKVCFKCDAGTRFYLATIRHS